MRKQKISYEYKVLVLGPRGAASKFRENVCSSLKERKIKTPKIEVIDDSSSNVIEKAFFGEINKSANKIKIPSIVVLFPKMKQYGPDGVTTFYVDEEEIAGFMKLLCNLYKVTLMKIEGFNTEKIIEREVIEKLRYELEFDFKFA